MNMPGAAYGSTWLRMTSHRVAPTPYAASRMPFGTARSASIVMMMTNGITRTASVSPPAMIAPPVDLRAR